MSLATARRDIEAKLADNWATTRIKFENVKFNPPAATEYWVRINILEEDENRINIGRPAHQRVTGTIVLDLFGPLNVGTNVIRGYAADLSAIFRDAQFNGITCREAKPTNVGEIESWYRYKVTIPFFYDGVYS